MYLTLVILIAIAAILLVLVVLIQNSKGGGLSSEFSGPGSSQMFSVKKTTDLVEQITWGLAVAIIIFSLVSYVVVEKNAQAGGINSVNIEKAQGTSLPGGSIPALPTAPEGGALPADSVK